MAGCLLDPQQDVPAHHHVGQAALIGVLALDGADHPAVTHDAHAVADLHHLVQLVRDEDGGVALGGELAQEAEETHRLLRREHGGGLVHDEHLGVAVKGLEDLHLLLQAHGQVVDAGVGVDVEAELLDEFAGAALGGAVVEHRSHVRLVTEHQVLGHRQRLHQHEVLVHHADA